MKLKSLRLKKSERSDEISVGYRPKPGLNKGAFLLVFAVLLSAASFYEGTAYQRNAEANGTSTVASTGITSNQATGSANSSDMQTGSFVRNHLIGQVAAISSKSITIQDQRTGKNTTLVINSSTQIESEGQTISASDIQTGDLAVVTKTTTSSSTAAKIIIAPGSWNNSSATGGQSNTSGQSETNGQSSTTVPTINLLDN
jgi:hypothetical protein